MESNLTCLNSTCFGGDCTDLYVGGSICCSNRKTLPFEFLQQPICNTDIVEMEIRLATVIVMDLVILILFVHRMAQLYPINTNYTQLESTADTSHRRKYTKIFINILIFATIFLHTIDQFFVYRYNRFSVQSRVTFWLWLGALNMFIITSHEYHLNITSIRDDIKDNPKGHNVCLQHIPMMLMLLLSTIHTIMGFVLAFVPLSSDNIVYGSMGNLVLATIFWICISIFYMIRFMISSRVCFRHFIFMLVTCGLSVVGLVLTLFKFFILTEVIISLIGGFLVFEYLLKFDNL
jgi:hypothetical protein